MEEGPPARRTIVRRPRSQNRITNPSSTVPIGPLDATTVTFTDGSGGAGLQIAVPNSPSLMELTLFHGWFVFDAAAANNPLGLVTSDAAAIVVGL